MFSRKGASKDRAPITTGSRESWLNIDCSATEGRAFGKIVYRGMVIKRLAALLVVGVLGIAVVTICPQIPAPVLEALTALQDAVQQFALEEGNGDFTLDDLLDSGLEARSSGDGRSCMLNDVKVWLLDGKHRIFVVCWRRAWYLLDVEGWRIFKVKCAFGPDEARRLYEANKAVFVGNLKQ